MILYRLDQPDGRVVMMVALDAEEIDALKTNDNPEVVSMAGFDLDVDVLLAGPEAVARYRREIPKFGLLGLEPGGPQG